MSTQHEEQTGALQGFPGGRVRLPRLNVPKKLARDDADEAAADRDAASRDATRSRDDDATGDRPARSATRSSRRDRATAAQDTEQELDGGFLDYFSTESLFSASEDARDDEDETSTAYAVLGLTRQATWKEISQAHRELGAMLHPDRYVDADDDLREAAERRVRDVNEAYALLRKQRNNGRS